ncbi:MAG: hypothetical protein IKC70_01240 [Bacteroidaceae bacterium]|nr:hypothetical protein [Bacteroidaceae bacterium]
MKILNYIFLSSLLLTTLPLTVEAQEKENQQKESTFAFKGLYLSADILGYLGSFLDDAKSGEIAIEANLGNRFFPTFEAGYASIDFIDENFGIHYKSAAPYFRAGLNYNFSYQKGKAPRPNYFYGALRFGCSKMTYDVSSPPIHDPVWGGEVPFSHSDVSGFASWAELGVGVNAKIWKNLRMGWCIRYKARLNVINSEYTRVGYIPGFGKNRHTRFGATYSIIYEIPYKQK